MQLLPFLYRQMFTFPGDRARKKRTSVFIDKKVPQVKFVDRTFNCRHDHAMAIWTYIHEHDNGITNFHFEVSADLLNEKEIALINRMRPGLIQLEIGVQSANEITIREINRTMKIDVLSTIVDKIKKETMCISISILSQDCRMKDMKASENHLTVYIK